MILKFGAIKRNYRYNIKMNKTDLIQKVKALDGLSQDERSYLINLVNTKKKYGLVWEDKPEEVEEQLRENLPVLKEVKDKAIVNGEEYPNHILIEGDNLHALTALSFTHEGKVDVIYIDPPYNTGNKDFKYNDSFVEREDSYRHSKWLSFIHKRLQIAKGLLKEKGVLFVSIDDNEQAQLKMLCDEVFKEDNFIANFLWEKTSTPPALSKKVRKKSEYVLCYEKIRDNITYSQGLVDGGDVPLLNSGNNETILEFPEKTISFKIPDGIYLNEEGRKIEMLNDLVVENGFNRNKIKLKGKFKWKQNMLEKELALGTSFIIKTTLFSIRFQRDIANLKTKTPSNLLNSDCNIGTNESAKKELEELNLIEDFDYPKPTSLISFLISLKTNSKAIILDFFAGTGTTLHSTIQLNEQDGGNRQCILVTNNENNICEEVTYERNKRVIQGYTNAKGLEVEGLTNNNLRYYKSEFVGRETSLKNKRELMQLATELLCIKEDCYTEQKIKIKQAKLFANAKMTLLILFDDHIIPDAVELIKRMDAKEIKVYVFSMGSDPYTEDFAEVLDKVTLCALPDAIYKAYQNVLPKKNRTVPLMEEVTEIPTNENGEQLAIL